MSIKNSDGNSCFKEIMNGGFEKGTNLASNSLKRYDAPKGKHYILHSQTRKTYSTWYRAESGGALKKIVTNKIQRIINCILTTNENNQLITQIKLKLSKTSRRADTKNINSVHRQSNQDK